MSSCCVETTMTVSKRPNARFEQMANRLCRLNKKVMWRGAPIKNEILSRYAV